MTVTVEMIAKLQEMGVANLWQKNGYSRLYIDLEKANDLYRSNDKMNHAQLVMNRRDRDNGKLWIDMDSCEICTKWLSSGDEVAEQIIELVNYYIAIDEAAEEENMAVDREVSAEIIAKINEEIAEHIELRKEHGAGDQNVVAHAVKLAGMIEVLSMMTGKQYKQTSEGLVEVK